MGATALSIRCGRCERIVHVKPSHILRKKYCSHECYVEAKRVRRRLEMQAGHKTCGHCKSVKPRAEFSPGKRHMDGLAGWCKACRAEGERVRRLKPHALKRFKAKYESDMEFRAQQLIRAIGKRCRAKRLAFDLDTAWLLHRLLGGTCELTGLPFDMTVVNRRFTPLSPSVDRIVANGGYTQNNCRVVMLAVNFALSNWGLETFLPIAEALVERCRRQAVA